MNDYPDVLGTDVQAIYYDLQSILYTCKKLNMTTEKISLTVESNERIDRAMPANLQSITMASADANCFARRRCRF